MKREKKVYIVRYEVEDANGRIGFIEREEFDTKKEAQAYYYKVLEMMEDEILNITIHEEIID